MVKDKPKKMTCSTCKYHWKPRVPEPKKCPKCLRWVDYPTAKKRVLAG